MKPLLYLEYRQFINSIKNSLRSPKRLIPMLLIGAWVCSSIIQSLLLVSGASTPMGPGFAHLNPKLANVPWEMVKAGIFLFLSLGAMLVIYGSFSSGSLIFSIAQIDFLFPTPISKKKVLLLKLIKDYIKYGFYVVFISMFLGTPVLGALGVSLFPYGLISIAALTGLLILVVNLAHTVNIVFTFGFERLKQAGWLIKGILIAGAASILAYGIIRYIQTQDSILSLLWAADSPVLNTLFAPAKWCSELVLAPVSLMTSDNWMQFALLWLLAFGSFLLLMSRKENLYEPSLGISVKYAKRRLAMRTGDYSRVRAEAMIERGKSRPAGLSLPCFGQGATALVWKNLMVKYRVSPWQIIFMLVLPGILLFSIRRFSPPTSVMRNLPFLMIYMTYIISMMAQADIRAELKHANVMKSMPISAWKVMMAQAVAGAVYLAGGIFAFAVWMRLLVPQAPIDILSLCAISAPFVGYSTIAAIMIPSLMYPDTRDLAQNYICGMFSFLMVSLAVVPTVVIGALLLFIFHTSAYITMAAIVLANAIIGTAGVYISGMVFSKFDPTSE